MSMTKTEKITGINLKLVKSGQTYMVKTGQNYLVKLLSKGLVILSSENLENTSNFEDWSLTPS